MHCLSLDTMQSNITCYVAWIAPLPDLSASDRESAKKSEGSQPQSFSVAG